MNCTLSADGLKACLERFRPQQYQVSRALALYSAAIAVSNEACLRRAVDVARRFGASTEELYEILLQSYLFLGFPRMLIAAGYFDGPPPAASPLGAPEPDETSEWYRRGLDLCKKVYGSNFERLRRRIEGLAPEILRWMLIEGYGKVLSRTGLDMPAREAAIVACLVVDNRPSQLYSHARGALNVGMEPQLLVDVIEDLGESAGEGYTQARQILDRLQVTS